MENFTLKEIVLEIQKDVKELKSILPDHYENTTFRKKVIAAIVGTARIVFNVILFKPAGAAATLTHRLMMMDCGI